MEDTYSILKKFVGKDIWLKCWIEDNDEVYGGYCYIRILKLFMDPPSSNFISAVIANVLPVYDLIEFADFTDLEEILETRYALDIAWIDFDVEFDAITTAELRDMGYQ